MPAARRRRAASGRSLGRLARVRLRAARPVRSGRHMKGVAMNSEATVPFVVGKRKKTDTSIVVLDTATPAPIPGPFELRAVFSR